MEVRRRNRAEAGWCRRSNEPPFTGRRHALRGGPDHNRVRAQSPERGRISLRLGAGSPVRPGSSPALAPEQVERSTSSFDRRSLGLVHHFDSEGDLATGTRLFRLRDDRLVVRLATGVVTASSRDSELGNLDAADRQRRSIARSSNREWLTRAAGARPRGLAAAVGDEPWLPGVARGGG